MDVKELIMKAAEEDKSYRFYMDALDLTKDVVAKVWLRELAEEELIPRDMLQNFDTSKTKTFKPDNTQDLHITGYLFDKDIMDFQVVLIVAIAKKEQKAYNFYISVVQSSGNGDMRNLCKVLSKDE